MLPERVCTCAAPIQDMDRRRASEKSILLLHIDGF